jgi:pullulanase
MYEQFGARVTGRDVTFRLFFPDNSVDPSQYVRGGIPHISNIRALGTFQSALGETNWDISGGVPLTLAAHPHGLLYSATIPDLPDGFYEYKYFVEFENHTNRWCGDPCSRYDGSELQNAGFVIGGQHMEVAPIAARKPLKDLVIYELMLDDFTAQFRGSRAPLDAVQDRIPYLLDLGVNAIEFMPWTAWPAEDFSWGYDPVAFFSVEHRFYNDPSEPLLKLFRLQRLISALHDAGLHVIMDGVFNHVSGGTDPNRGFGYKWFYQKPADSPFLGSFEGGGYFDDFDYDNACTAEFVTDACKYWIDEYRIDGIRFDYVKGFYRRGAPTLGISKVISELNDHAAEQGLENLAFTLEMLTDNRYEAIGITNAVRAGGCWYDPLMWQGFDAGRDERVRTPLVRALNAGKDCDASRRPVTYVENHDHSTATEQCGGRAVWWRTQPLAIALLMAAGVPLIHNGQEFGDQYWFPEEGSGRVMARPVRWQFEDDDTGRRLRGLYKQLISIRMQHPALRSLNVHPDSYDERTTNFDRDGFGVSEDRGLVVFHRWGPDGQGGTEKFIVVLNFSAYDQMLDVPFSDNGTWRELLEGWDVSIGNWRLANHRVGSHWGRIFVLRST